MTVEFGITTIGVFVGMLNQFVKAIFKNTKIDINPFIPVLSIVFGVLLGIAGYFTDGVNMGDNIITAIFIGASAGSSSTCVHQMYKQTLGAVSECEDEVDDAEPVCESTEEVIEESPVEQSSEEAEEVEETK